MDEDVWGEEKGDWRLEIGDWRLEICSEHVEGLVVEATPKAMR